MCYHTHTLLVGDTDGLVKGKRYFYSPAKHGKVVRLSSVVAVLPNKVYTTTHPCPPFFSHTYPTLSSLPL